MTKLRSLLALALALLLPGVAAAQGAVLRVAPGGAGGACATIQAAVDAAADGDLVLVATGTYAGFTVSDKAVTVAADAGAQVVVTEVVQVLDLAPSRSAALVRLRVETRKQAPNAPQLVRVAGCSGAVLLQDVVVQQLDYTASGPFPFPVEPDQDCVLVESSACVTIVASTLDAGGGGGLTERVRGAALRATDSDVLAYGTTCRGAMGMNGLVGMGGTPGQQGLAAVSLSGGTGLLHGCTLTGGQGGSGAYSPGGQVGGTCTPSGAGGPALVLGAGSARGPLLRRLDTALAGGLPGPAAGPGGQCGAGATGVESVVSAGAIETVPAAARRLTAPSVAPDQTVARFVEAGAPFDLVWIGYDLEPACPLAWDEELYGVVGTAGFIQLFFLDALDATGAGRLDFLVDDWGAPHTPVRAQTFHWDGAHLHAANPRLVLVLDDV